MSTNIPVGSALARKIYSVGLFTRVQHAPGFMNLISGEMPKEGSFAAKSKDRPHRTTLSSRPEIWPRARAILSVSTCLTSCKASR